jgi:hypothetical protein
MTTKLEGGETHYTLSEARVYDRENWPEEERKSDLEDQQTN